MFSRVLSLALCLVCTPCFAVEITTDTVLTESVTEEIHVRGDARLTVDMPVDTMGVARVHLHDTATLELLGGKMDGRAFLWGDNTVEIAGGRISGIADQHGGHTTMTVSGGILEGEYRFLAGGTQEITVTGLAHGYAPWFIGTSATALRYFVSGNAGYGFTNGRIHLGGTSLAGDWRTDVYVTAGTDRDVAWLLHAPSDQPGDVDGDGLVGVSDLNVVRNHFGTIPYHVQPEFGDTLPYDVKINVNDLNLIRNSFGSATTHPTPEPSSALLGLVTIGLASFRRWRLSCRAARS